MNHTYLCRTCGSDDLSYTATVEWNASTQKFDIIDIHDDCYCENCQGYMGDDIKELPHG